MIKTFFYTFLQTKHQEEIYDLSISYPLFPQEIEIRPIFPFPWEIVKTLTIDEVCEYGNLKLPMVDIRNTMFRHVPENSIALTYSHVCKTRVLVKDLDTDTVHVVTLWKCPHESCFAMHESWIREFVQRRRLVDGMVVGLYWDDESCWLCFSVLSGSQ